MLANSASLQYPLQSCFPKKSQNYIFTVSLGGKKKKVAMAVADSAALSIMPSLAGNLK